MSATIHDLINHSIGRSLRLIDDAAGLLESEPERCVFFANVIANLLMHSAKQMSNKDHIDEVSMEDQVAACFVVLGLADPRGLADVNIVKAIKRATEMRRGVIAAGRAVCHQ